MSINKVYCAVFGCLNSFLTHPGMSFFRLPGNSERSLQWLQLICRDDLQNKPKLHGYRVCEIHFNKEDILQSSKRKVLKKNVLPSMMLPSITSSVPEVSLKEDKQTQTHLVENENCKQTGNVMNEIFAPTPKSISSNTPRKRKLKVKLDQFRKKIKLLETENKSQKSEEETFHRLCDKFLPEKLALLTKAQSKLKHHGKGNRYDKDYITYCLNLYHISPQAYRFLQSALCLPCPSTLYSHSFPMRAKACEFSARRASVA